MWGNIFSNEFWDCQGKQNVSHSHCKISWQEDTNTIQSLYALVVPEGLESKEVGETPAISRLESRKRKLRFKSQVRRSNTVVTGYITAFSMFLGVFRFYRLLAFQKDLRYRSQILNTYIFVVFSRVWCHSIFVVNFFLLARGYEK